MAIRIEKDEPTQPRDNNPRPDPQRPEGGGGGGGLLKIALPILLMLFSKNPKLAMIVLVIGGAAYYVTDGFNFQEGGNTVTSFSQGCDFDEAKYASSMAFEPLANNYKNAFPTAASLLQYAPPRLNQGSQGSCVGWASAYGARSILEARETGKSGRASAYSPAFLYNQIALTGCQGAYLQDAMESMKKIGALPAKDFEYDQSTCSRKPNSTQKSSASAHRTKGYNRLTKGGYNYKVDMDGIRQNLAKGAPVVIGMQVGGTFMRGMEGKAAWTPSQSDYALRGFGGHAMCVIGYDDNRQGGSFQIMNSWGERWGDKGVTWVSYKDFDFFVKEAYGLYPMGKADTNSDKLSVQFGLVDKKSMKAVPLKRVNQNIYSTRLQKEQRFKLEVTNSLECYAYIFAEQTDGTSNVLFPYDDKSNPYLGVTGTRLFPRNESLFPDTVGDKDRFAIVITKTEVDFNALNTAINASRQKTFAAKIIDALGDQHVTQMSFDDKGTGVSFESDLKGKNAVSIVVEVAK